MIREAGKRLRVLWYDYHNFRLPLWKMGRWRAFKVAWHHPSAVVDPWPWEKRFYYLDRDGWPVERIKGRPITNLIRLLLHCRKVTTRRPACLDT